MLHQKRNRFVSCTAKLDAMSPLKVLSRGYSIVNAENGAILRSVRQTAPKQQISVMFADGSINAIVSEIKEEIR